MRTLDVYLDDTLVGSIAETRKGGRFAYTPETVERLAGSPVLSLSLPAKRRPFGEAKTSNWFNGLLPEGPRRDEVCRSLGISPYDWMGLLAEIGWECAGAVRVFPRGCARGSSPRYREISKEELAASLSNISLRLPRKNSGSFRMSLGGFQEKCASACRRLRWVKLISAQMGFYCPKAMRRAPIFSSLRTQEAIRAPRNQKLGLCWWQAALLAVQECLF